MTLKQYFRASKSYLFQVENISKLSEGVAVIIVSNVESKNKSLDRRSHICVKLETF